MPPPPSSEESLAERIKTKEVGEENVAERSRTGEITVRKFTWKELSQLNKPENAHVAVRGKVRFKQAFHLSLLS